MYRKYIILSILLLILMAAFSLTGCQSTGGSSDGDNTDRGEESPADLIALTQLTDLGVEIFLLNLLPDSAEAGPLTESDYDSFCPVFSPDTSKIVYQSYNESMDENNLNLVDIKQEERSGQLTQDGVNVGGRLSWSQNSNYIIWSGIPGKVQGSDIFRIDVRSGEIVNLTGGSEAENSSPDWSPEEDLITFDSNRGNGEKVNNSNIWIMDKEGGSLRQVTDVDAWDNIHPSWSPDGSRIAFYRWGVFEEVDNGPAGLWLVDPDGSNEVLAAPIPNLWGPGMDVPVWSPDGNAIAFQAGEVGSRDIYVISIVNGEITQISDLPGEEGEVTWSPDSSRLVFTNSSEEVYRLYLAYADGTGYRPLLDFGGNGCADWMQEQP